MNKTDKKREKLLIKALTLVCEDAKIDIDGFQWLTHKMVRKAGAESLAVICVFCCQRRSEAIGQSDQLATLKQMVASQLAKVDLALTKVDRQILLDYESRTPCIQCLH